MKLNKHIFSISLGTALFVAMVASSSAVNSAGSVKEAAPVILASAHSVAAPRANKIAAGIALPQSIPVPCPIWILGQITGYSKTTMKTADGATPNPKLVPGGIWFMQKFSEAAAKTL